MTDRQARNGKAAAAMQRVMGIPQEQNQMRGGWKEAFGRQRDLPELSSINVDYIAPAIPAPTTTHAASADE
jgi:hypothetical protein